MIKSIKTSQFVKRQTRTSDYSYYEGSWENIETLTSFYFNNPTSEYYSRKGYRDDVYLVSIPPEGFYSSVVKIDDSIEFKTIFETRREGEKPYKKSIAYGKKYPAKFVDIILYSKEVLEEDETDRESLTGADFEIISINARSEETPYPIAPQTMARNQLADDPELGKGGSKANYTGDEFAKSIIFWNTHCLVREKEEWNDWARKVGAKKGTVDDMLSI